MYHRRRMGTGKVTTPGSAPPKPQINIEPSWVPNPSAGAAKQAVLFSPRYCCSISFDLAEGANNGPVKPRVVAVAAAATEAPPHHPTAAQEAGAKRCGIGPQGHPHMMRKRALRRAINPAQRTELAQCRGRTIRAERQPCDDELPPLIVD